ncbi:MAG: hypothetical protein HY890_08580 [Deltaproteobacteria bacterium]|nr:hypothetical protein [Deltaproteobacteria bacterium]
MHVGINQNIIRDSEVYHLQTEDGGRKNPVITTVLFKGGRILLTRKTPYSDILKSDKLSIVVKEIINEQHASVLKELQEGRFDDKPQGHAPGREKPAGAPSAAGRPAGKAASPPAADEIDEAILDHLSLTTKK